ncbi:hypothetical protein [Actinoplanes sp. NPDC051859]|uniref:hypothetical protein n=1 Tax=Actinoplanes sp. NPDC051859 TaxID=3363909 RepID=UPI003791CB05
MDQERTAALLKLALHLREVAKDAHRPDVVAKMDETIALIAGKNDPAPDALGKGPSKLDTALTILGIGGLSR